MPTVRITDNKTSFPSAKFVWQTNLGKQKFQIKMKNEKSL